jgi:glutamate carboxypeptidase
MADDAPEAATVDPSAAQRIRRAVDDRAEAIGDDLLSLVERETPTTDPEASDEVRADLARDLQAAGPVTGRVPGEETGGRLEAGAEPES